MSGTDRRSAGDCMAYESAASDEQRRLVTSSSRQSQADVGDSGDVTRIPGVDQRCDDDDASTPQFSQPSTTGT